MFRLFFEAIVLKENFLTSRFHRHRSYTRNFPIDIKHILHCNVERFGPVTIVYYSAIAVTPNMTYVPLGARRLEEICIAGN